MNKNLNGGVLTVFLSGHIDSSNANETEKEIMQDVARCEYDSLVLDLKDLEYISSAGLRILLKLRKQNPTMTAVNASADVYEIFEVTGFTELFPISKAMREISIDGCEVVGEGANGIVYRIARDTIVKVYKNPDSLDEIRRERELSRTAFVLGIPTAIAYDVVRVGESYGAVFELLDAKSFAEMMQENPGNLEFVAQKSVEVAKIIHSTLALAGLPSEFDVVLKWIGMIRDYLTEEEYEKFLCLVNALPHNGTLIHGDYHIKNVMQMGEETLLIDMDTLSIGHPIFELAFMYNAYKGFGLIDPSVVERFMGISADTAYRLWHRMLALYIGSEDEERLNTVEEKAELIGLLRLMRRRITKGTHLTPEGLAFVEACRIRIKAILQRVDTLDFECYEA